MGRRVGTKDRNQTLNATLAVAAALPGQFKERQVVSRSSSPRSNLAVPSSPRCGADTLPAVSGRKLGSFRIFDGILQGAVGPSAPRLSFHTGSATLVFGCRRRLLKSARVLSPLMFIKPDAGPGMIKKFNS